MEFFEKAHVLKSSESKSKNSTENVKKQLKQMLYGYKVSDNKLIHNAGNIKNDFDESTSVSGFSDLNLTISSQEDDTTRARAPNDESSLSDTSENSANVLSDDNLNHEDDFGENTISDTIETNECLSEDAVDEDDVSSISEANASLLSEIFESSQETETDSSIVFDADGNLAAEILKKLELTNEKKQKHKRKYSEVDNDDYSGRKGPIFKNKIQAKVPTTETSKKENASSSCSDENDTTNVFESSPKSPPFVSITASDMPNEKLDDIIGEYIYSTIRNLPSENFNTVSSTNNSGIFIEESMNVDIQTEDDVCSLIPEVDDTYPAEAIDTECEDPETGDTHIEESINLDNTLISELTSDTELLMAEDTANLEETFKLYYAGNSCIITLKHPSELFIQGKVKIKALFGKVEVFGHTLKDDFYNIYAPYYNFAQLIRTVEHDHAYYGLFGKLTSAGVSTKEAEDIVTSIGNQDGVIILQSLEEKIMDFVDCNFKATNLFAKPNKIIESYFIKACDILNCSLFSAQPWKSFEIHPTWKEANVHAHNKLSKGIVCGGAGVGKSTYLRYQVNKLLDNGPVLVVDLDPGQCEFNVAGNIGATIVTSPLFGPSFTHLMKPEIMLNIGMINTMDNAKRYVSAVHRLITHCSNNETLANMPWIINTMGMTNVLGHKFITLIIILSKPTYLVQYESKSNKKRFESFLRPHNVKLLYEDYRNDRLFANMSYPNDMNYSFVLVSHTERSFTSKFSLRPKDERYLNFLAYFSQLINIHNNFLGIVPYQVHLKDLYIGTNVIIKEDCVTKVINGKVVALCQQERQCVAASSKVFTLSDKPLRCYGHGLIRGVDWEKDTLYVITPVPSNELGSVDTLVYADWVPELMGQESQLPKGTVVPYRTITQDHNKQLMSTPRRRFNPLQLLKMARNSKIESLVN